MLGSASAEIGPADIKRYAAHLSARGLSSNRVRLAIAPVRALLATVFEDELIPRNPRAAGESVRGLFSASRCSAT